MDNEDTPTKSILLSAGGNEYVEKYYQLLKDQEVTPNTLHSENLNGAFYNALGIPLGPARKIQKKAAALATTALPTIPETEQQQQQQQTDTTFLLSRLPTSRFHTTDVVPTTLPSTLNNSGFFDPAILDFLGNLYEPNLDPNLDRSTGLRTLPPWMQHPGPDTHIGAAAAASAAAAKAIPVPPGPGTAASAAAAKAIPVPPGPGTAASAAEASKFITFGRSALHANFSVIQKSTQKLRNLNM